MKNYILLIASALVFSITPIYGYLENPDIKQIKTQAEEGQYWISSTGKTHNSSCRYYRTCKGHASDKGSGNNCKICGGASR